jgi:nicotinate-nucleotide adenylyltransferase
MSRRDLESGGAWGILGGAFDPIHNGHLTLARDIQEAKHLNGILIVPSFSPPHRSRPCGASYEDRIEMLRLAVGDELYFIISRVEQELPGPGYTIAIVRELKKRYAKADLKFILGADNLTAFWSWHQPEEILSEIKILAGARPGFRPEPGDRFPAGTVEYIPTRMLDVSSSAIRKKIGDGIPLEQLAKLVPERVAAYIYSKGLYR